MDVSLFSLVLFRSLLRAGRKEAAAAIRCAKRAVKSLPVLWVAFADHPPTLQLYVAQNQLTSPSKQNIYVQRECRVLCILPP